MELITDRTTMQYITTNAADMFTENRTYSSLLETTKASDLPTGLHQSEAYLNTIHYHLVLYLGPVLLLVGVVCNVLTVLTLIQSRSLHMKNTSFYFLVLVIVNTFALVAHLGDGLLTVRGIHLRSYSHTYCKAVVSSISFLQQLQAWVLVNMGFERLTSVYYPRKIRFFSVDHNNHICLLCCILAILSINVAYLPQFTTVIIFTDDSLQTMNLCARDLGYSYFGNISVWFWIHYAIRYAAPFFFLTFCTVFICGRLVYNLYEKKNLDKSVVYDLAKLKTSSSTTAFLVLGLTFLMTSLFPCALDLFLVMYYKEIDIQMAETWVGYERIVDFALNINYVIEFFALVTTRRWFRRYLIMLFTKTEPKRNLTKKDSQKKPINRDVNFFVRAKLNNMNLKDRSPKRAVCPVTQTTKPDLHNLHNLPHGEDARAKFTSHLEEDTWYGLHTFEPELQYEKWEPCVQYDTEDITKRETLLTIPEEIILVPQDIACNVNDDVDFYEKEELTYNEKM